MNPRESILKRLRAAAPAAPLPCPDAFSDFNHSAADLAEPLARLERFRELMTASHAEVHLTFDSHWPDLLLRLCQEKGIQSLLYPPGTAHGQKLEAWDFLPQSLPAPLPMPQRVAFDRPIDSWKSSLFNDIDASFTSARAGIADTGALVLWPDAHQPRTMSLVPPVHFVLLQADHLYANFQQVIQTEQWWQGLPTNALLISGPSKTADIQQTLAYGAHGPKELVVLITLGESTPQ